MTKKFVVTEYISLDGVIEGSLARRYSRCPDLRAQSPAARPVGRELSAGG